MSPKTASIETAATSNGDAAVVDELAQSYLRKDGHIHPWFSRRMAKHPPRIQEKVWERIKELGLDQPKGQTIETSFEVEKEDLPPNPISKTNGQERKEKRWVRWDDDEWDQLADHVWRARRKDQVSTIYVLARKGMAQFPQNRKRNLTTVNAIQPLLDRLKKKREELDQQAERAQRLEDQLQQRPDKETMLEGMTDDEAILRFKSLVLESLTPEEATAEFDPQDLLGCMDMPTIVAYLVQNFLERTETQSALITQAMANLSNLSTSNGSTVPRSMPLGGPPRTTNKKLRIAVIGMKPNQTVFVTKALGQDADFHFVPKDMKANGIKAITADIIALWGNFCSHQDQVHAKERAKQLGCKFVMHHGGVEMFIQRLTKEIGKKIAAVA